MIRTTLFGWILLTVQITLTYSGLTIGIRLAREYSNPGRCLGPATLYPFSWLMDWEQRDFILNQSSESRWAN